jgi:hypothetical protein
MNEPKRFSLVKPNTQTLFRIDFDWWKSHDNNWRVYMLSCLCPAHQAMFENSSSEIWLDWIDPQTAEVKILDGMEHILLTHCAKQPDFINANTSIVDAVFRILLANQNKPMTLIEIGQKINRPPEILLRTLAGSQVYKGIRATNP